MKGRRNFLKSAALLSVLPAISLEAMADNDSAAGAKFRVLTANIRVDLKEDEAKGLGWKQRRDFCIEVIKKYKPDLVGFQEVFYQQAIDLRKAFKDYYFLGYDGPEMAGVTEYAGIAKNPLLIKKSRFELLSVGSYWLSETPNVAGSESWGTYRARHVNYAILRDQVNGKDFRFINTHLTTKTTDTKVKQVAMIVADSKQYKERFPQILTGDFNSSPTSEPIKLATDNQFIDEFKIINGTQNAEATGHGFLGEKYQEVKGKAGNRIDYIFTRGDIKATTCALIKDKKNDMYPSDHFFMYADMTI
ncbi:endonuclease/exonuclease/phosphatase family protein [Pedobacter sp. UBA4863]|uniref:endonuclease/exonuclease/phosphatase family protein n=1 Tax=Pedobacter sp. UBA4863 TaxID=1947060 RepID=UPI0025CFEC35|nr:endonuclease/exonuclease/phosphatase family protein [Pedobacter sp. UBA4863]